MGKVIIKRALALLFIPGAAVTAAAVCWRLARFTGQTSLPKTPVWLMAGILLSAAFYLAAGGAASVRKWAAFCLPLTLGFIALAWVLLAGKLAYNGFYVPGNWVRNPYISACGGVTLLAVIPAMGYRKPIKAFLFLLLTVAGLGAAVWSLSSLTLGAGFAAYVDYPFYHALRVAKGGEMIGRMESFLVPVALCVTVLIAAACMTVIEWGIRAYGKVKIDKQAN
jgi:hypothetical protein